MSQTDNHREVFGVTNTGRGLNMWSDGVGDWSAWHDMWSPSAHDVGVCSNKDGSRKDSVPAQTAETSPLN